MLLGFFTTAPLPASDSKAELEKRANALAAELVARIRSHGAADGEVQRLRRDLGSTLVALELPKKALDFLLPAEVELAKSNAPTDDHLVSLRCQIAHCWFVAGKPEKGLDYLRGKVRTLAGPEEKTDTQSRRDLAAAMDRYAPAFHGLKAFEESGALFEKSLAIHRELDGETHIDTIGAVLGYGACEIELGRGAAVKELLEKTLATLIEHYPAETGLIQTFRNNIALVDGPTGDRAKQVEEFRALLAEMVAEGVPETDERHLLAKENLAFSLALVGEFPEAISTLESLITTLRRVRPRTLWKERIERLEEVRRTWRKPPPKPKEPPPSTPDGF